MTTVTTSAPPPGPVPFDKVFAQSWAVFKRNWIIALPPVIAIVLVMSGFAVFLVAIAVAAFAAGIGHASSSAIGALVLGYCVFLVLAVVVCLWGYVGMFGMADAAWTRGTTSFGDGFAAFRERAGAAFLAGIGVTGLAIVAVILALPTLGIALLALPLFIMYVMPSVVVGRRGGFEAIGESFRLVRRFFGPSAITALILLAISYGISMIGAVAIYPVEIAAVPTGSDTSFRVPPIPLLVGGGVGYLLTLVVSTAYYGFVATVLVAMYRDLIAQPERVPVAPVVMTQIPAPVPPPAVSPAAPPAEPPPPAL